MSINQAVSFPRRPDRRLTRVAIGFLLLLVATMVAAVGSNSNVPTLTANQIAENF